MKNKRIIFLDFDGCIVTRKTRYRSLDPDCMAILKKIVTTTKASIVISSCWKHSHTLRKLQNMLKKFGINNVIGVTPNLNGDWVRGKEIEKWIQDNGQPQSFIIIDDDTDMEPYMDRLVHIDCQIGLTKNDSDKAIEMLKNG